MSSNPAYGDDTPIAAFATPLAESALAIIRTSGRNTPELLANIFSRPEKLLNAPGNSIIHGWIVENSNTATDSVTASRRIDEVLVSVYRAPRSYTGEDSADISCHGGIAAAKAVMGALKAAGFRDALPGEFTFRAFMNNKLDLTRSESVMELVSAKTDQGRRHAVNRLSGALEQEITGIKNLLVQVLAETEIYLDYSEEEVSEGAGNFPGLATAGEARSRLETLAATYRRERLYQEGALAVIAGRPNAGKSSLFNLLLKEDRSIVTDIPGTTRDWIEALVGIEGIPVRLADTAGLRGLPVDSAGAPPMAPLDPVEKIGIERSRELLAKADLVLYVIDGAEGITAEDRVFLDEFGDDINKKTPMLILWNKADIAGAPATLSLIKKNLNHKVKEVTQSKEAEQGAAVLPVSAKTGVGIPALTAAIAGALTMAASGCPLGNTAHDGDGTEYSPGIATPRQKELVDAALDAVTETLLLTEKREPLDLIAPLLREAVNSLGEITGEVSTADILETMFSRFCVGK
ncbi:tRNA modification GTPase MnmE [Spirochaetia bacterium]|nr:tRNA modification GTPase MnmE [Spirochaetia bacterium]